MTASPTPDSRRDRIHLWHLRKRAQPSSAAPASDPIGGGVFQPGIGQGVFDRFHRFDLAPDDQMPASRLGFLAIPGPYPAVGDIDLQLTPRAVARGVTGPVLGTKPFGQALHGERRRGSLMLLCR